MLLALRSKIFFILFIFEPWVDGKHVKKNIGGHHNNWKAMKGTKKDIMDVINVTILIC
jgi:hypothetical protein